MSNFWLQFIVQEAIGVASAFLQSSHLSDPQKAAAQQLIAAGQAFLATL